MTTPTLLIVREAQIELQPGERYAGLVLDAEGHAQHHLVLLPGQAEAVNWTAAKDWAASAGGITTAAEALRTEYQRVAAPPAPTPTPGAALAAAWASLPQLKLFA